MKTNKWLVLSAVAIFCLIVAMGCSGTIGNPVANDLTGSALQNAASDNAASQTHLWGYYDIYFDITSGTASAVINRDAMYSCNVMKFLNNHVGSMKLKINGIKPVDTTATDVDFDIKLTHPFPGMKQYNGYDVRAIFIGDGSATMAYNSKLKYAAFGSNDQVMYDYDQDLTPVDPYPGKAGNPDGYTRWWNPTEFITPNMFGWIPSGLSTPGYVPTATLNPYKYFADDLTPNGDVCAFLATTPNHGVFSSGHSNTRNYYIRFPKTTGIKLSAAVLACWKNIKPEDHPANSFEAVAAKCDVTPDLYYISPTIKGGDLKLDLTVYDWVSHLSAGVMEDYKLIIESTVLSAPATVPMSSMIPTGGGVNYSTYHVDIPADNIHSTLGNEYWVIVEDQDDNYKNPFGFPNNCGDDKLAAFFRFDLFVSDHSYNNTPPIVDSGVTGNVHPMIGTTEVYTVTAHDPDPGDVLVYNWTVTDKATGIPDPSYNGVPGNGDGTLTVDWATIAGVDKLKWYDISCTVTDGKSTPVPANTLAVRVAYEVTINVPSFPLWTDSGITLQPGDTVICHDAVGEWSWGGGSTSGPEGDYKPDGGSDEWISDLQHGELIGYIGPVGADPYSLVQNDPAIFAVGIMTVQRPALPSGLSELWFGFNDDYSSGGTSDNYGAVDVKVIVE